MSNSNIIIKIKLTTLLANPELKGLADVALYGHSRGWMEGEYSFYPIQDNELTKLFFNKEVAKKIVANGGDVLNYQFVFEVNPDSTIPQPTEDGEVGIRDSTKQEFDGGAITPLTWREWKHSTNKFLEVGEKKYLNSLSHVAGIKSEDKKKHCLLMSEIVFLMNKGIECTVRSDFHKV